MEKGLEGCRLGAGPPSQEQLSGLLKRKAMSCIAGEQLEKLPFLKPVSAPIQSPRISKVKKVRANNS